MKAAPTTKIWADTIRQDVCQSGRCRQVVFFAQNVRTGNFGIFDTRPEPIARELELETQREKWTIDLTKTVSHFATCVSRKAFKNYRRRR